jgi:antitoxin CcdA
MAMPRSRTNKQVTNVSIDKHILARARSLGLNVSRAAEEKLAELIKAAERTKWLEENREAVDAYNRRVEENGVFGDDWRQF